MARSRHTTAVNDALASMLRADLESSPLGPEPLGGFAGEMATPRNDPPLPPAPPPFRPDPPPWSEHYQGEPDEEDSQP